MLDSPVLSTICNNTLWLLDALKQKGIVFSSRISLLVISVDVVRFNTTVIEARFHFLNCLLLSLDNFVQLYNLFPSFSHLLLLITDILFALHTELEKLFILEFNQMIILFNHVIFALIEFILDSIKLLLVKHFGFTLSYCLHLSYFVEVFRSSSDLILHT